MKQFDAAETGNLQWFIAQQAAGTLPDLMQDNDHGWYPHELAAQSGHIDVLRWLVEDSGQAIDVTSAKNTAVRAAAYHGHLPVVRYLVEDSGQAVDVTADDNFAVRWAAMNGHLAVIKYLVEDSGQAVDVTVDNNFTVQWASKHGHLDVVRYRICNGAETTEDICRHCNDP